jgi:hypothetical protein
MGNLEKRVAQIEDARANSDLKKMSDEELSAYTATLDWGAPTVIEALQYRESPLRGGRAGRSSAARQFTAHRGG